MMSVIGAYGYMSGFLHFRNRLTESARWELGRYEYADAH